ncbi:hypothetical protein [Actinocorallia libanotica]|uniref:Membrane protein YphA (DoxX/SURF4 family) n=1 Tax=Actinocorallia libanotica TaxID=46162 RepID=A0ABP4BW06_9ACTN
MPQDPYTTRRDFALPGQASPDAAEGGQDGSDVTPPLGAAYPEQRPPAIDFAQTVRDPAPSAGDAEDAGDAGDSGGEQTLLDRTRPVPLPQQDQTVADVPRDVPVAPLPLPQSQAAQEPPPAAPRAPRSQPPQQPAPAQAQPAQAQPAQPQAPQQAQPAYAPQGFPPPQAPPQQGFPPQGHLQPPAPPPAPPAAQGGAWHRQHYAVGVFLVLYGLVNLATGLLGFSNRKVEAAVYFGDGLAAPILIAVKCAEALLLAVAAAGLLRRRDLWFLPALLSWVAGFAVLCVLDVVKGEFLALAEHAVYTLLFGFLLFLSYALSAKVRAARLQAATAPGQPAPPAQPGAPGAPGMPGAPGAPVPMAPPQPGGTPPAGLSRTQEIALNTLNRWQRPGGR